MKLSIVTSTGRQWARTRWNTHDSGAAFDKKKTSVLTEPMQHFIAQQTLCVIAGPGLQHELCGTLTFGLPGFAHAPDSHTCLLHLDQQAAASCLISALDQQLREGQESRLGLFFISHATRERLCVQGPAHLLPGRRGLFSFLQTRLATTLQLSVHEAFFHCAKYIKTHVPGLTVPANSSTVGAKLPPQEAQTLLSPAIHHFIQRQSLCFLCTVSQEGQCAINHRGGAPGFLVSLPPYPGASGGTVLLPDYEGNGAFEAIGNILETGVATLLIPDYTQQCAVCISGHAEVMDIAEVPADVVQLLAGAKRAIKLSVQHVEIQQGHWSQALAHEQRRAQQLWAQRTADTTACKL